MYLQNLPFYVFCQLQTLAGAGKTIWQRVVCFLKAEYNIRITMDKLILQADELDGLLTLDDKNTLCALDALYAKNLDFFRQYDATGKKKEAFIELHNEMEELIRETCYKTAGINVYTFSAPAEDLSEVSRIIAKLRNINTENHEFIYYIQRSFELLFKFAWGCKPGSNSNYLIVKTPVASPEQNYAAHRIANIDDNIENTVMCVLLRGALLPSMIMSKEIKDFSSQGYITPFALFNIKRDDSKKENNMEYILDIEKSFFNLQVLDGKDLIFADPMSATGGSLVTVVNYLLSAGIKPRSIKIFNVISALKGALRTVRSIKNCEVYTLNMDPVLNKDAYIMPGLGDAGDRINGKDEVSNPRNITQLIAGYGNVSSLYRDQLNEIENTVQGCVK
jgi:uracil phosphoribosyltransferase